MYVSRVCAQREEFWPAGEVEMRLKKKGWRFAAADDLSVLSLREEYGNAGTFGPLTAHNPNG